VPETLGLIAGRGIYPLLLAESAKKQGVGRVFAVAFKGETSRRINALADEVTWINLGQLQSMLDALAGSGAAVVVMAGQITPTALFRVRMDRPMLDLLRDLPARNAETIFGAVGDALAGVGVTLMPASAFMESHMPGAGLLTRTSPTEEEEKDISLGIRVAKASSGLDIGQTIVLKQGTILAVEAFEGTDRAIRRAGRLGGPGAVVVKVAKQGHDMRFDIPVVGTRTLQSLRRARARVLVMEAGRCILLEREKVVKQADAMGVSLVVREMENIEYPTRNLE
jgi:hypothetical protein